VPLLARHWAYCLAPTRPDVVTVTFSTGKVYRFDATLSTTCQPLVPIETAEMQFTRSGGRSGRYGSSTRRPPSRSVAPMDWARRCNCSIPT
jgi:hypothetical protein